MRYTVLVLVLTCVRICNQPWKAKTQTHKKHKNWMQTITTLAWTESKIQTWGAFLLFFPSFLSQIRLYTPLLSWCFLLSCALLGSVLEPWSCSMTTSPSRFKSCLDPKRSSLFSWPSFLLATALLWIVASITIKFPLTLTLLILLYSQPLTSLLF